VKTSTNKKVESSSSDSDSSDSDSDSSDSEVKKPVVSKASVASANKASTPAAKVAAAKASAVKTSTSKKVESSSSDSDSSDSDSDSSNSEVKKPVVSKASVAPANKTPKSDPIEFSSKTEYKIYVKGLPWNVSETDVADFFKSCGKVLSAETPMGEDGRSTGTAYVKFSSKSELNNALELDGQYWPGTERWLKILEGIDKPERKSMGSGGVRPEGCDTVHKLFSLYYFYSNDLIFTGFCRESSLGC
jgi:nucleolin